MYVCVWAQSMYAIYVVTDIFWQMQRYVFAFLLWKYVNSPDTEQYVSRTH